MQTQIAFLRAFFVTGTFALVAVQSFDTHAAPAPDCVLIANDVTRENAAAWRALGFRLEERRDIESLPIEKRAALLDDTHFALIRKFGGDVMWLSTTHGRFTPGWVPAQFAAPARGATPDARYGCGSLQRRLPFYAESRAAVGDIFAVAHGLKIRRTVGEAVLDLERNYLVTAGYQKYERTEAKRKYLAILAQVKALTQIYPDDFFTLWLNVRKLVYSKNYAKISYCDEYASMTNALVDRCVSCIGETYLMTALFIDSGVQAPAGYALGTQTFTDHIRPVLYNLQKKRTLDLVTGGLGPFRSAIMKPNAIFRALYRGGTSLRPADEAAAVERVPVDFVYRDWKCIFRPTLNLRHPLQSAELNGLSGCQPSDPEGDEANPHRASNQGKTEQATYDETQKKKDKKGEGSDQEGAETGSDQGPAEKKGEGQSAAAGGGSSEGPGGGDVPFFARLGQMFSGGGGRRSGPPLPDHQLAAIKAIEPNLNAADRRTVRAALASQHASPALINLVNEAPFVRDAGLGHLLRRDDRTTYFIPFVEVNFGTPDPDERFAMSSATAKDTTLTRDGTREFIYRLVSSDRKLCDELRAASLPERLRILVRLMAREAAGPVAKLRAAGWPANDLASTLNLAKSDAGLRANLVALMDRLDVFSEFLSTVYGGKFENETVTPITAAYAQAFATDSGLEALLTQMVAGFDQVYSDPVAVAQWLAARPENAGLALGREGFVTTLGEIHRHLRKIVLKDQRFTRWADYDTSQNLVTDMLLFHLLGDRTFFFTVEPERDEHVAERPTYPLQILDPRVSELLRRRESLLAVPINLPTFKGLECAPGERGFKGSGIVIECGRGEDAAQANERADVRDQRGVERGAQTSEVTNGNGGQNNVTRAGFTRDRSRGEDLEKGRPLEVALTPEQQSIQASPTAVRVTKGSRQMMDAHLADPRQEVHLPVAVWASLLESVDKGFLVEPVVQLLTHHAYRRRLAPVFDAPTLRAQLRLIDFPLSAKPDFVLPERAYSELNVDSVRGNFGGSSIRPDIIKAAVLKTMQTYDLYEGLTKDLIGLEVGLVARRELRGRKPGFIYLQREGVAATPEEAGALLRRAFDGGGEVPARTMVKGRSYETLGDADDAPALLKAYPQFRATPSLELGWGWRSTRFDARGQVLGVLNKFGRYFGHAHYVYYSYATDEKDVSARLDRAYQDMVIRSPDYPARREGE